MGNNKKGIKKPPPKGGGEPVKSKNLAFFLGVLLLVLFLLFMFRQDPVDESQIPFSDFLVMVDDSYIKWDSVKIIGKQIEGNFTLDRDKLNNDNKEDIYLNKYKAYIVPPPQDQPASDVTVYHISSYSPSEIDTLMINKFAERGMNFSSEPQEGNIFTNVILPIVPWLLIFGVLWFFMFRQIQGTGNKAMSFGKSKARLAKPELNKVTFADVAGVEEAKEELKEIVEFLKKPERFKKLGAKIPKGVLLVGPPGTGKTLLSRSVAGEANRPFFSMSGSEFVEMFVGVGASRVRDLFDQGKKNAPCIIFIDELDAVGRMRGSGYGGGHDEREQTLNQMLVEMDGFDTDQTVIIMAATNRPDVLDPALLRPGRFDRRVVVHLPDVRGREDILKIHMKNVPCSGSVDAKVLARGLPGFSGADIANLVNESALIAARRGRKKVQMEDFEYSKDKVLMGVERRSMIISEKERVNTAYHEAGHAILAYLLPNVNQLHKVSIIPRGQALGVTQTLPLEERYTLTREYVLEEVMVLFGGRIGEEYKFGPGGITNGSSNDIEKGTKLVRTMICEWGMSDVLGPITYGQKEEPIFIGKEIARHKDYSERTAEMIDNEVKKIVDECFKGAKELIMSNVDKLEKLAKALLSDESLDIAQINVLLGNGKKQLDDEEVISDNGDAASVLKEKREPSNKAEESGVSQEELANKVKSDKLGKMDDKQAEV